MERQNWAETQGSVNQVYKDGGGNANDTVAFAYVANGHLYSGTFTAYFETYKAGQKIVVQYDPNDPGRHHFADSQRSRRWLWLVFTGLVIIVYVSFSAWRWLYS